MRRIMADIAAESSQFVETPYADQKTIKIPEGESLNKGRSGIVGVGANIRSQQSYNAIIEQSGQFLPTYRDSGSRFLLQMNNLRNADKEEVTDTNNPMGGERGSIISYTQHPGATADTNAFDNTNELYCIKMIPLERWAAYSATFGFIGLLGVATIETGNATIRFWGLYEINDLAEDLNYQWRDMGNSWELDCGACDDTPQFDFVEMGDGSLTLAASIENGGSTIIKCFRSFDMGNNWVETTNVFADGGTTDDPMSVAVGRIGDRIVVCASDPQAGDWFIYSFYSDDGGASWSSRLDVATKNAAATHCELEMVRGQNGVLYLGWPGDGDAVYTIKSEDGINWTSYLGVAEEETATGFDSIGGFGMLQRYYGRWEAFAIDTAAGVAQVTTMYAKETGNAEYDKHPLGTFATEGIIDQGVSQVVGLKALHCCAREFNRGGFVDIAIITSNVTYFSFHILRVHMWSGIQLTDATAFDHVWVPNNHPGTGDNNPHSTWWTGVRNGTGTYTMERDNNFHHLSLTADGGDESYYSKQLPTESFDTGIVVKFEARNLLSTGYTKVHLYLASDAGASDKYVNFTFIIASGGFILYDDIAGANADTYVPTEDGFVADMDEWNEYMIVALEDRVEIYRAPANQYREIQPYELILAANVSDPAWAADDDVIVWGVVGATAGPAAAGGSDAQFRNMMYKLSVDGNESGWDFDDDMVGQRCHTNKIGTLQGMAVKFVGDWALENDEWQIDTGAHFEGENIFIPSPRRCWKEPVQSAGSPDRVFTWERKDVDDQEMEYVFNAIAIFNTNTFFFKLEGENFGGGGAVTLFNSPTANSANFCHSGRLNVAAINKNVITWGINTSNWDTAPIPGQYASNEFRNWYIYMYDGVKTGQVYRILNNTETQFILERSAEDDGVAADKDEFYVFSDRFFYVFGATQTYSRLTLTVQNGDVPYFPDNQCRVGTVILGQTYDLDDDLWESSTSLEPNIKVKQARAGSRNIEECGQERRSVSLGYTGLTDRGMGIEKAREFFRILRWGVRPVVWIDHDDVLDAVVSGLDCHSEPMLANVMGYSQSRKAYRQMTEFGDDHIRNYLESGIKLEEVL